MTISKGLHFVLLGALYKTNTLAKIVMHQSRIMFEPFSSDLKTILKGSSFLGLQYLVFAF